MSDAIATAACPRFGTPECPAAKQIARLRSRVELYRQQLTEQAQGLGERLAMGRDEALSQAHRLYEAQIHELKSKLEEERREHRDALAREREQHNRIRQALTEKIADQAGELALYRESGPPKGGRSESFAGNDLSGRKGDKEKRKRKGKRKGHGKGGRRIPKNLPVEEHCHRPEQTHCPFCGRPFDTLEAEISHEIDVRIEVNVIRHVRGKCVCACRCAQTAADAPDQAVVQTAALPPKAMHDHLYTDRTWVELLLLKYDLQIPLNRIVEILANASYKASSGTICRGFMRLGELLAPLDRRIIEGNLDDDHWSADESSLPVFEHRPEHQGFHWACWQILSSKTRVYFVSASHEAEHMQTYFAAAENQGGTLHVDRASTFKTLWLALAFCWAHVRRDFIRLGRYVSGNRQFACDWLGRIRKLYHLYKCWQVALADDNGSAAEAAHLNLRQHVEAMEAHFRQQLRDHPHWPEKRRKVLLSLERHWEGLTRFLDDPLVPLDTNHVERGFQVVATFRRSSFGCRNERHAHLLARFLTVLRTLRMHDVPLKAYLLAWLEAVAEHHPNPVPDVDAWMPWSFSEQVRDRIDKHR